MKSYQDINKETIDRLIFCIKRVITSYLNSIINLLNFKETNLKFNSTRLLTQGNLFDTLYNKILQNSEYIKRDKHTPLKLLTIYKEIFFIPIEVRNFKEIYRYKGRGKKTEVAIPVYEELGTTTYCAFTDKYLLLDGSSVFIPEYTNFYLVKIGPRNVVIDETTKNDLLEKSVIKENNILNLKGKEIKRKNFYEEIR